VKFLEVCKGKKFDVPPVWLMRQAGRYMPEYRELRKKHGMLELCTTPELAKEVTLMPIRRFGFDAAILFSDITIPYYGLGVKFEIKEGVGPVVERPIRNLEDTKRMEDFSVVKEIEAVAEAVKLLKKELPVPLIGFVGAPFTLAAYLIEGKPSRDFKKTKAFMFQNPDAWNALMDKLTDATIKYGNTQIDSGVDVMQVFDSWVGGLNERSYKEYVAPWMKKIFSSFIGLPTIHFGTNTSHLLHLMKDVGADVIGVDWRTSLREAYHKVKSPIQGNLDPAILFGTKNVIEREVQAIKEESLEIGAYIFNLGHGVLPETPIENVEILLKAVRS
jgi:uroporphyrinogen decarboxylase